MMSQRTRVAGEPPNEFGNPVAGPRSGRPILGQPSAGLPRRNGYRVRIVYTEPEFQRRNPEAPSEYASLFDFPQAHSDLEAIRQALAEWDFCARHSGVGWQRLIRSVKIER